MPPLSRTAPLFLLVALATASAATSRLVKPGPDGRLVYEAFDDLGGVLPDFSHCGYRGGGVPLPTVPVVETLSPTGAPDEGPAIQAALDRIAKLKADGEGRRGALLLTKGDYPVKGSLFFKASGLVLRGETGTRLIATLRKAHDFIDIGGGGKVSTKEDEEPAAVETVSGEKVMLPDQVIPVGARKVKVSGTPAKAGDTILLIRPPSAPWITELGMDRIPAKKGTVQWDAKGYGFSFERKVLSCIEDTLVFDVPVPQSFEPKWGGAALQVIPARNRLRECGVENLILDSEYDDSLKGTTPTEHFADENHGWVAVNFGEAEDGWVRNVEARHFGMGLLNASSKSRRITCQDSVCLDPVSKIEGGRRYSYHLGGAQALVTRCTARDGRHDFVLNARTHGPNVFLDCVATRAWANSETHHRWAMGGLYDRVRIEGDGGLVSANRGQLGSGHGWTGNTIVFWNCTAPLIMVGKPPTGQNFAIGTPAPSTADRTVISKNVGLLNRAAGRQDPILDGVFQGDGWHESPDGEVEPKSLYLAQLADRLGPGAVKAAALWSNKGP